MKMDRRGLNRYACLSVLAAMATTVSCWAAVDFSPLKGIYLDSSSSQTRIVLRSTNAIPYKVVSKSGDSIVLDLTVPGANDNIQTDFAQAKNIEQVVLKPVGQDQLRVIIKGQQLAEPVITLPTLNTAAATKPASKPKPVLKEVIAPKATASEPTKNAVTKPKVQPNQSIGAAAGQQSKVTANVIAPMDETTSGDMELSTDTAEPNEGDALWDDAQADLPPEQPVDRAAIGSQAISNTQTVDREDSEDQDSWFTGVFDMVGGVLNLGWDSLIKLLILGALALFGFQWFMRKPAEKRHAFWDDEAPQQQGHVLDKVLSLFDAKPAATPVRRTKASRQQADHQRPVGLQGLEQSYPQSTSLARTQASRQYSAVQSYGGSINNPINSDSIDRELKRSLAMRQAMSQHYAKPAPKQTTGYVAPAKPAQAQRPTAQKRPAAPMPTPSRSRDERALAMQSVQPNHRLNRAAQSFGEANTDRPLRAQEPLKQPPATLASTPAKSGSWDGIKNNNEVLDFLRNVADLVEKEGNSAAARGLKRGLASTQL